jgi:putative heme-binding domain-containing protein
MLRVILFAGLMTLEPGVSRAQSTNAIDPQTSIAVEALSRLKGVDLEANPTVNAAVLRVLSKTKGTPQFVELVRDFKIKGQSEALLDYALAHPSESVSADAVRLILADNQKALLEKTVQSTNAAAAIQVIGNANEKELRPLVQWALQNTQDTNARRAAVRALAKSQDGATFLLKLTKEDKLPADVRLLASSELNFAPWPQIKSEAAQVLPLPQGQNAEPLPPIHQLIKRTGNARHGSELFKSPTVGCSNCHQINGEGMNFGPALSEIGTKLGKDALYESILDPSAGIAFGYEGWSIELKNGDEAVGLITSETADEIALKTQNGITTKYKKSDIARRQRMALSIMPAGLQLTMSADDLVDLVEFLASLRKPQ